MVNWEEVCERADASLSECEPVKKLADSLRVKPLVLFGVGFFFLFAFLLYGFGGQLICGAVGFAYPAFESFKVIDAQDHDGMRFWLTYWVVFAAATLLESIYYYVLVWLPFYYPLKLALLVWLFSPSTRGAEHVYGWLVSPILQRNREHIDSAIEASTAELKRGLSGLPQTIGSGAAGALAVGVEGVAVLRRRSRTLGALGHSSLTESPTKLTGEPEAKTAAQLSAVEETHLKGH